MSISGVLIMGNEFKRRGDAEFAVKTCHDSFQYSTICILTLKKKRFIKRTSKYVKHTSVLSINKSEEDS